MRNPGGYAVVFNESGVLKEQDTASCAHCNRIYHLGVRQRLEDIGGLCGGCKKAICAKCHAQGGCDPIEEKLKRMEQADRLYRDMRG